MEYFPTQIFQFKGFLYSAGLGFTLGLFYDLIRILFFLLTGSDKKLTVIRDIIYMLFCLTVNFIFLLVICEGQILFYVAAGEIIGLAVFEITVGKPLFCRISVFLKKIKKKTDVIKQRLLDKKQIFYKKIKKLEKNTCKNDKQ